MEAAIRGAPGLPRWSGAACSHPPAQTPRRRAAAPLALAAAAGVAAVGASAAAARPWAAAVWAIVPAAASGMPRGRSARLPSRPHRRLGCDWTGRRLPRVVPASAPGPSGLARGRPARAAARRTASTLDRANALLDDGLGGGLLLLAGIGSAVLANRPGTAATWLALWEASFGLAAGLFGLTVRAWVNEGLMALFFFYVGLVVKKELVEGSLASRREALLPCFAAVGGMVTPMLVYAMVNYLAPSGSPAGLMVPVATDIAFAAGVFSLFRDRMPAAVEPFLLALATVDDLGAIVIIALSSAGGLAPRFLAGAAAALAATYACGRFASGRSALNLAVPGAALWYCLLRAGLSADIAGFLVALCVPVRAADGAPVVAKLAREWAPICGFVILPLFALANCAIPLGSLGAVWSQRAWAVPAGVGVGLLLGKPLGIFGFGLLGLRSGWAALPAGASPRHLAICGILGSMGFTMCLVLIEHFLAGHIAEATKVATLLASLAGACASSALMRAQPRRVVAEGAGGRAAPLIRAVA